MIVCYILILTFSYSLAQECNFPPSPSLSPPKPELPLIFQTRVEINSDLKKSTIRQIYYDSIRRKASLIDQSNNFETRYIFDYPNNEIHILFSFANQTSGTIIEGDSLSYSPIACDTFKLTDAALVNYFFGFTNVNETFIQPETPYHVLNFRGEQFYSGTNIVRGIPVDIYKSCQYIPEIKSNFTATYYFTRFNYSMPNFNNQYSRVPLRAEFKGKRIENGVLIDFSDVYDYYDFRVNRNLTTVFMTPPGVVCLNRNITLQLPNIPTQYKFSEEITSNAITSYIKNLYYNELYQAVRYERRNQKKEEQTFYNQDPLITLHDYNIGVSFSLNKIHKNCTITGIPVLSFDSDKNYTNTLFDTEGSYVIRLKSPKSFLLLDSDYVYTGKRLVNNVPSNIFVSDRSQKNKSIISEFAFSSGDFTFHESNQLDKNVPVSLWVREGDDVSYSSFFDYDSLPQDFQSFDVSECFPGKNEFDFRIKFSYKKYDLTPEQLKEEKFFKFAITLIFVQLTNESFTRFSTPRISASSDGYLYIRSSILPQPPAISMFTAIPKYWLISPSIAVLRNVTTPEECAEYCIKDLRCLSFDFGIVSFSCYLNTVHSVNGSVSTMTTFVHYSRNTLNGFYSRKSFEIWSLLEKTVRDKKFILPIKLIDPQLPTVILEAESIDLVSNDENRFGTTQTLSKYNRKYSGKSFKQNIDKEFFELSIDDCAKACNEEYGFECKSFDFCYLHGDCRISKSEVSSNPQDFFEQNECDVYEKDSLFHYNLYPTKSSINKNDLKIESIKTASQCASMCDNEKKIHCRSFNFCPEINSCFLSDRHVISDSEQGFDDDLVCSHYWRDYLADFSFSSSANISLSADIVYEGVNLEQCSFLCVTSDGFNCKSLDYCPQSKKCLLNKGLKTNATIATQNTDFCFNYRREYFYVTSSTTNTKVKNVKNNIGVIIGLGFGFTLIGLIIGVASMVFFMKRKNMI